MKIPINLSGSQAQSLHEALLIAYPNRSSLTQMVRFKLNENLDAIADGDEQSNRIFKLIEWATAKGRLQELVEGAVDLNPNNHAMKEWVAANSEQTTISVEPNNPDSEKFRLSQSKNIESIELRIQELISILELRAENIRTQLSQYYDYASVKDYLSKFNELHRKHIDALKSGNLILAHEILSAIHVLSNKLEGEEFWAKHKAETPLREYSLRPFEFLRGRLICEYVVGEMRNNSKLYPINSNFMFGGPPFGKIEIESPVELYTRVYNSK